MNRKARLLVAGFFGLYVLAVVWPGALLTNRVRPLVLGLPFTFFWAALWIAMGGLVLWALDRAERGRR